MEKLQNEYDLTLRWVHFPLHPETPAEGVSLTDLFAGRDIDIDAMKAQMKARMDAEGLPYGDRDMTFNSRLAQELGSWAETVPGGNAIHDALFQGYFVDNRNIGDVETLLAIVESVGLPEEDARDVLENRTFSPAVDADWALSRQVGVTGVPTFVAGGYGVVGAQDYEVLASLVDKALSS